MDGSRTTRERGSVRGRRLGVSAVALAAALAVGVASREAAAVAQESAVAEEPGGPGWVPEAERGTGTGRVQVRLRAAAAGGALGGRVRLWRLGVPASAAWLAGDQIQAEAEISESGTLVEGLPHGRYRIEVLSQGASREDPPAFAVGEERVSRTVEVHPLTKGPVRLRIFRTDGTEVEEALRLKPDRRLPASLARVPAWARPRRPTNASRDASGPGPSAGSGSAASLRRDEGSFRLGKWTERARDDDPEAAVLVTCPAREFWVVNHVYVPRGAVLGEATMFVAVVPDSPEQLLASVREADGGTPKRRTMNVWSRAIAVNEEDADTAWRRAPVHVSFESRSRARLEFEWTVESADAIRKLPPAPE